MSNATSNALVTLSRDESRSGLVRLFFKALGWLFFGFGLVGIVLPILPTAPFLIVSVACFARGDRQMMERLFRMPGVGKYLRDWQEGRGISAGLKLSALLALWFAALTALVLVAKTTLAKLLVLAVALFSTLHLLWMPTQRSRAAERDRD
ncbi:MAG: YbaN family protein [Gammaproteobacteria bacterium]|nr:YbaN family protein [Gammaproteobacteria bacterium]